MSVVFDETTYYLLRNEIIYFVFVNYILFFCQFLWGLKAELIHIITEQELLLIFGLCFEVSAEETCLKLQDPNFD